jgi:hypothetical protein
MVGRLSYVLRYRQQGQAGSKAARHARLRAANIKPE